MNRFLDQFLGQVFEQGRTLLFFISAAACLAMMPFALRLPLDPSNSSLLPKDSAYQDNEYFQKWFGNDDSVIIALQTDQVFNAGIMNWIQKASQEFKSWPGIISVHSLSEMKILKKKRVGIESINAFERWQKNEEPLSELRRHFKDQSTLSRGLLSPDETMTLIEADLNGNLSSEDRHQMVQRIRDWLDKNPVSKARLYLSGTALEQDDLIAAMQHDHKIFVPLTFALVCLLIGIFYGHWKAVLYPAAVIIATLISTQAWMFWRGEKLSALTLLVAPMLVIISVAESIHLQSYITHIQDDIPSREKFTRIIKALLVPCFYTSATTVAGLASLALNPIPAVRQFGLAGAFGTSIAYVWTLVLAPFFINLADRWHREIRKRKELKWRRAACLLGFWIKKQKVIIVFVSLVLLAAGSRGLFSIRSSTDILEAFKPSHPFRRDTETIQKSMGGIYPLEFVIETRGKQDFSDPDFFKKISAFKKETETWPGVSHTRYLSDLIDRIHALLRKTPYPNGFWLGKYIAGIERSGPELSFLMTPDFTKTRMTLFLSSSDSAKVLKLAETMKNKAAEAFGARLEVISCGQVYLLARMSESLVQGQVSSLGGALALVGAMMMVLLRSLKLGIFCFISNMIPIVLLLALMPVLGIPLNTASATIGSIALGLIVDNAIHLLYRLRESRRLARSKFQFARAMMTAVPPVVISSAVLAGGFSISLLGSILPTVHFGILMMLVIFLGLAFNLIFLLAIYLLFEKRI